MGHWLILILFGVALATGYAAFDFDLKMRIVHRDALFAIHRLSGLGVGLLLLFWIGYRLPALPRLFRQTPHERAVSVYHACFALLCVILPVLPWIGRALDGRYHELYAIWPVANLVSHPAIPATYKLLHMHKSLVDIVLWLLLIHVVAALLHQFVVGDNALRHMLTIKDPREHRSGADGARDKG